MDGALFFLPARIKAGRYAAISRAGVYKGTGDLGAMQLSAHPAPFCQGYTFTEMVLNQLEPFDLANLGFS